MAYKKMSYAFKKKYINQIKLIVLVSYLIFVQTSFAGMAKNFQFMEATNYLNKPDLGQYSIETVSVIYEHAFFKTGSDKSELPTPLSIKDAARRASKNLKSSTVLVLDIESWPIYKTERKNAIESVNKYISTLDKFKKNYQHDNVKIGYYGIGPVRDYWRAIKDSDSSEYKEWQAENDTLKPLISKVEALFPSIYTFYRDIDGWKKYAIAQIKEARRISQGKKVYCFLWPRYHDSNRILGGKYLPGKYWRAQLELVYEHADGLIIWDGARTEWDEDGVWWNETIKFIKENQN